MLEIDRPPLLFPEPALADRAKKPPARSSIRHPSVSRQSGKACSSVLAAYSRL